MKIEEYIFRGIEAADRGEIEHALLHACLAIDACAQKRDKSDKSSRASYTQFIRDYYWILEPMISAGINFDETQWDNIDLIDGNGKPIANKDMASFIYHMLRCSQAHGKEIPHKYKLLPRSENGKLAYHVAENMLRIPETIVWGLIGICVFTKINADIETQSQHWLSLGQNRFAISDWWGLEESFRPIANKHNSTRITLQNLKFAKQA